MGDLNRDGVLDIVSASSLTTRAFLGKGDGSFDKVPTAIAVAPRGIPTAAVIGDIDGDSHFDLAVVVSGGFSWRLSLVRGNGDGTFRDGVHYNTPRLTSLSGGDFDNNGTVDLVGAGPTVGLNVVLQRNRHRFGWVPAALTIAQR